MSDIRATKRITQEVVVGKQCDNCHKRETDEAKLDNWFHFVEGHGGWGNDNVDSIESYDVCSPQCFVELAKSKAIAISGYPDAEVADMPVQFLLGLFELLDGAKQ